jgi:hypothetical protein
MPPLSVPGILCPSFSRLILGCGQGGLDPCFEFHNLIGQSCQELAKPLVRI